MLLLAAVLCFAACINESSNKKQQYAQILTEKKWQFDWTAMRDTLMSRPVSDRDIRFFETFEARSKNAIFEFKEDGKLNIFTSDSEYQVGLWSLDGQNNTIKMELYQTALSSPLPIMELNKERVVLGPNPKAPYAINRIFVPYIEDNNESE